MNQDPGPRLDSILQHIDVFKTCRDLRFSSHYSFLNLLSFPSVDECLSAVECTNIDLKKAVASPFFRRSHGYFWWVYWTIYMQGYLRYSSAGRIDEANPYYRYLTDYFLPINQDPGICPPTREDVFILMSRRFDDFDAMRLYSSSSHEMLGTISPLQLYATHPTVKKGRPLQLKEQPGTVNVRYLDGHHRLFMAALCGIEYLPCIVQHELDERQKLLGKVERFRFDGKRLLISGWIVHPQRPIQVVDIRVDGETTALGPIRARGDVAQIYPHVPHALQSGFSIDVIFEYLSPEQPIEFEVVGLTDWSPVGLLTVNYIPEGIMNLPSEEKPSDGHQNVSRGGSST